MTVGTERDMMIISKKRIWLAFCGISYCPFSSSILVKIIVIVLYMYILLYVVTWLRREDTN